MTFRVVLKLSTWAEDKFYAYILAFLHMMSLSSILLSKGFFDCRDQSVLQRDSYEHIE